MPKLMTYMEQFEDSLTLTKFSLFMSGINIYPKTIRSRIEVFLNCLFYLNFLWLYTDVIGEFYWLIEGIQIGKSFSELTLTAPCTTICLLATAKSTPIYYNKHLFTKIVNKLRELHKEFKDEDVIPEKDVNAVDANKDIDRLNYEEGTVKVDHKRIIADIVKESTKILNIVIYLLYYSSIVVVVVFSTMPFASMAYDYHVDGETELKFPFLIKYFFDPFTRIRFPLVYFHQVWSTLIAAFNVFGSDTWQYAFCMYTQMHFQILGHNYEHVISSSDAVTRKRLGELIKRHQELIQLVDDMELIYSKSTLFNILSSSLLICLSGFNIAFVDDLGAVIAFSTFLVMSLSQISLLCFFGDMLMRSSARVSESIYKCRWYDADAGTKQAVLFIITRAQKPCRLTAANFANLNLTAFTTILSRSWSYFALLKTMYK